MTTHRTPTQIATDDAKRENYEVEWRKMQPLLDAFDEALLNFAQGTIEISSDPATGMRFVAFYLARQSGIRGGVVGLIPSDMLSVFADGATEGMKTMEETMKEHHRVR